MSSASETITCKIAPLGWTQDFTNGSGKLVYDSPDVTETGLYLRVDDTNAIYAIVNMYENMSSVDTGTGKSPYGYWSKSDASSSATRPWTLIGTSKCFWFGTYHNSIYTNSQNLYFFGDPKKLSNTDSWCSLILADSANIASYEPSFSSYSTSSVFARPPNGIGGTVQSSYVTLSDIQPGGKPGSGATYPSPTDNSFRIFPVYAGHYSSSIIRGILPGIFFPYESVKRTFTKNTFMLMSDGKRYLTSICGGSSDGNIWFSLDTNDWQ